MSSSRACDRVLPGGEIKRRDDIPPATLCSIVAEAGAKRTRHASFPQQVGALSGLVVDLTKVGLDYYFLRPLQQAKFGFVARQTASLGMAGALRLISPVIRSILAGANTSQLRVIAKHIRQLM